MALSLLRDGSSINDFCSSFSCELSDDSFSSAGLSISKALKTIISSEVRDGRRGREGSSVRCWGAGDGRSTELDIAVILLSVEYVIVNFVFFVVV